MPTVLITGASSGIGRDTALYMRDKGWNVVATMRNPENCRKDLEDRGIAVAALDVMDRQSIRNALSFTLQKYGSLDVLVNNAGYALQGIFEASRPEEVKKQFDTNVLGLMDVCREVLPVFRKAGGGSIVNVASIGGRIGFPLYSLYNSSKWAVEGFSEALAYELRPLGIRVKVVEPGIIRTDFYNRSLNLTDHSGLEGYAPVFERMASKMKKMEKFGSRPDRIARLIYKAAKSRSWKMRYNAGAFAFPMLLMKRILPERLFNFIMRVFTS